LQPSKEPLTSQPKSFLSMNQEARVKKAGTKEDKIGKEGSQNASGDRMEVKLLGNEKISFLGFQGHTSQQSEGNS